MIVCRALRGSGIACLVQQQAILKNVALLPADAEQEAVLGVVIGLLGCRTCSHPHTHVRTIAAEAAAIKEAPEPETKDLKQSRTDAALQAILARNLPGGDGSDMSQPDSVRIMRFGDLPSTTQLVESFQGAAPPKHPLYDLPAWLGSSYPGYDTRPKSPFYNWVAWVRQNLPAREAAAYLALDQQMQRPERRAAIMRKAKWELTQLWHWQHQRMAAGLPVEATAQEQADAAAAAAKVQEEAGRAAVKEAGDALTMAEAARIEARQETGWKHELALAKAAAHHAHAVEANARGQLLAPDMTQATVLQALAKARNDVNGLLDRVHVCARFIQRLQSPTKAASSPATAGAQSLPVAAPASADASVSVKVSEKVAKAQTRMELLTGQIQQLTEGMQQLADSHVTPPSPSSTATTATARPAAAAGQQGRAADPAAAGQAGPAVQGSSSSARGSDGSAGSAGSRAGLLAAMDAAETASRFEFTQEQTTLLNKLKLDDDQWALLRELRRSAYVDGSAGTPALINDLMQQLARNANAFKARIKAPTASRMDRAGDTLQAELLARKEATGGGKRGAAPAALLYSSGSSAIGKQSRNRQEAASTNAVMDASMVVGMSQLVAQRRQGKAEGGAEGGTLPVVAGEGKEGMLWTDLPVFDPSKTEGLSTRQGTKVKLAPSKARVETMALSSRGGLPVSSNPHHRQPYTMNLSVRPPTYVLDLVTDFMQIKYQDVLLRRDAVTRMETAMSAAPPHHTSASAVDRSTLPSHAPTSSAPRLSPQEIAALNGEASRLFDSGDAEGYAALAARMAADGLIGQSELVELVGAAQRRAETMKAETSPGVDGAKDTASDAQRAALASLLTNPTAPSTSTGTVATSVSALAKQEWARALQAGPAKPSSPWGLTLAEAAARLMTSALQSTKTSQPTQRPPATPAVSPEAEALRTSIVKGQLASWEQAERVWHDYLDTASGGDKGLVTLDGPLPTLDEVVHADAQLQAARAAVTAASASKVETDKSKVEEALRQAEAAAAKLNKRLDGLHLAYLSKLAGADSGRVAAGETFPAAGTTPTGEQGALHRTHAFNATLDSFIKDPARLLSAFKGSQSVNDLLKSHAEQVSMAHLGRPAAWSSTLPAWDQIWSLMRSLYAHYLTPGVKTLMPPPSTSLPTSQPTSAPIRLPVTAPPTQPTRTPTAQPTTAPASQPAPGIGGLSPELAELLQLPQPTAAAAQAAAAPAPVDKAAAAKDLANAKWRQYCAAQDAMAAGTQPGSSPSWLSPDMQLAPPYPGARPILRFTQCFVLGPASALSTTQGLSERLDTQFTTHPMAARKTGYRPPPALLPDHPAAKRVLLKVQVLDLAQEVGLSQEGIQHLLRIAGPRRYDVTTGELTLLGTKYAAREENRRWCMEVLHLLLEAAHAAQAQHEDSGALLLTRPGVTNLLNNSI